MSTVIGFTSGSCSVKVLKLDRSETAKVGAKVGAKNGAKVGDAVGAKLDDKVGAKIGDAAGSLEEGQRSTVSTSSNSPPTPLTSPFTETV
mmetsp:Transcript_8798/g.12820  ORF Transcript_8798/g.12820 Transcript_8798/m.12820 type:complete len:90 (-) Transcript_8798:1722-1991(-)